DCAGCGRFLGWLAQNLANVARADAAELPQPGMIEFPAECEAQGLDPVAWNGRLLFWGLRSSVTWHPGRLSRLRRHEPALTRMVKRYRPRHDGEGKRGPT